MAINYRDYAGKLKVKPVWAKVPANDTGYLTPPELYTPYSPFVPTRQLIHATVGTNTLPYFAAPGSPPALNAANYVQPDISMQALSLGGSAWSKVKKFDLDSNQGLAHDWTIEATTDPTRIKIGDAGAKLTVQRFLESYVGSLIEFGESASGRLGQIIATIQGVDAIGTGTPSTTQIVCTVPKPDNTGAKEEATNDDDTESADIEISYDTTLASGFSLVFRDEVPASAFIGS